jgi:nucleoside-diphosphate-sugar epimerase
MTPILVTGGAGFIGSHTCKALYNAGFLPVAITVNKRVACPGFVTDVAEKPRIQNVGPGILAESPTKFTSRRGRI